MNRPPTDLNAELEERLRFEMLLTEVSARFVSVTAESIDDEIVNAQRQIVQALDLDRSVLGQLEEGGKGFAYSHSWYRPGLEPLSGLAAKDLPWIASNLARGEVVCFSHIADLPEEAAREKEVARCFGLLSNATFPLKVGGKLIGAISFGTMHREREWQDSLVSRLRLFVEMIGSAIARTRSEQTIREGAHEVRRLRDQLQRENVYLQQEVRAVRGHSRLIGESAALRHVLEQVEQVATTNSSVLLIGETGTGKELLASAIHELSPRGARPMVRVNCAAIPGTLIESELFGREKGAYTGALSRQVGRFEVAHGSTLFLDEIGELPPEVQVKLLRVLQEKQLERLGSPKTISVDVRIIAATNQDLKKAVSEKRFRDDLFYRLNVFPIRIPPLRERPEDIPLLIQSFADEFALSFGKGIESIDKASIDALQRYNWPGNVREVRNVVERAVILANGPRLHISLPSVSPSNAEPSLRHSDAEREHVRSVLEKTRWRVRGKAGAAEILDLKPSTLESKMVRLGITRKSNSKTD
ncbi:MAG TPA: sigma 54-interacting transcriptional regulator [Candidatus Acidoferrum sp.]|nr:sigma 54-interacting transcriptional regulator [Candidatus Acidoferrum sp.]